MSLTPAERNTLADVQAGLARSDPGLAASFGRLGPHHSAVIWLAGALAVLGLVAAAVLLLGVTALGVLALLLVLGSPVAVALAPRNCDGPPERI